MTKIKLPNKKDCKGLSFGEVIFKSVGKTLDEFDRNGHKRLKTLNEWCGDFVVELVSLENKDLEKLINQYINATNI